MAEVAKPEPTYRAVRENSEASIESSARSARPARILCVDDEPAVLTILSRALGNRYEIVTVDDPVAALALLERGGDFSVVISDLKMPQMDGADFLARAKLLAPTSSRLALTGCLDRELAADEVFGILTKPCPLRLLNESVTAAVQHHLLMSRPTSVLPLPHELSLMSTAPPDHADMDSGIRRRRAHAFRPPGTPSPALRRPAGARGQADECGAAAGVSTLVLLGTVAHKFFLLGQGVEAERILRAPLEDLAVRAQHGLLPSEKDTEAAALLASRLAEETLQPLWIDYVFQLFLTLGRPLPPLLIERMHTLIRLVPGASRGAFREYVDMLRASQRCLGAAEHFLLRRIEGLEPLFGP